MSTPLHLLQPPGLERDRLRRQSEHDALVALSQAALGSVDVGSLLQMAVERVADVAGVDTVTITELDQDGGVIRARVGDPMETEPAAGTALGVAIPSHKGSWGTLRIWTKERRRFSREDSQFVELVACVVGWVVARREVEKRLAEALQEKDRGLRLETALSRCARALLGDYDPAAVENCLSALMEATNASFGYIDWHESDNGSVPSLRLSRDGRSDELDSHWDRVSWDDLPTLKRRLEIGESVVVIVRDLPPEEAAHFLTSPELIMTELDVPIMIRGAWKGTIGLGVPDDGREWDREVLKAVEHASSLFSTWSEKRDYAIRLEEAVEERNRRIKLEQSVTAAAQLLSQSNQPGDLDRALCLLLDGAGATSVFVERNVLNESGELCSRVVSVAQRPDSVYDPSYWDMMPWADMPDTFAQLSQGEVAVLIPERMEGREAETYAVTPVKSEVDVPILIDGAWEGLIGLADENSARDWSDEIQMLHTAAEMVGSFWSRIESSRRLEELARSKDEFIASISHELRTPLTAVVGLAEALVSPGGETAPEEVKEFIKIIAEQSGEMAAIVQDLLVVARSDIGRVTIRPEPVDLLAESEIATRGVRWEGRERPVISGTATALADPLRVRQIIRNLLTNALRYGGRRVQISLSEAEGWARVKVMDDGAGIPIDDRERIFRPYERAHHRLGQPASVGLGLTVSRQLASLMGGSLDYAVLDDWSTFELRLPGARLSIEPET